MINKVKIVSMVCVATAAGFLASTLNLSAQQDRSPLRAATRLAVCDMVHVFNKYQKAVDLTRQLDAKGKKVQAENQRKKKEIEKIENMLKGLKGAEYERRYNELRRLEIERKAWLNYQEERTMREHHRLTKEMYQEILRIVEVVAEENGFDIVLQRRASISESMNTPELLGQIERRQILYSHDGVDITQTVLQRVNSTYKESQDN